MTSETGSRECISRRALIQTLHCPVVLISIRAAADMSDMVSLIFANLTRWPLLPCAVAFGLRLGTLNPLQEASGETTESRLT